MAVAITKEEARAKGLSHYFTGIPCANGHIEPRRLTGHCLGCVRDAMKNHRRENLEHCHAIERAYEIANREKRNKQKLKAKKRYSAKYPERVRQQLQNWHLKNPDYRQIYNAVAYLENAEARKAYQKRYRTENPEKVRAIFQHWVKNNPVKAKASARASSHNRRTREKLIANRISTEDIERLFALSDGLCKTCAKERPLQIDHIIAVANGGTNDLSNLQLLCGPCNRSKGRKDFKTWLQEREQLAQLQCETI